MNRLNHCCQLLLVAVAAIMASGCARKERLQCFASVSRPDMGVAVIQWSQISGHSVRALAFPPSGATHGGSGCNHLLLFGSHALAVRRAETSLPWIAEAADTRIHSGSYAIVFPLVRGDVQATPHDFDRLSVVDTPNDGRVVVRPISLSDNFAPPMFEQMIRDVSE